jgi:hypothetical protein
VVYVGDNGYVAYVFALHVAVLPHEKAPFMSGLLLLPDINLSMTYYYSIMGILVCGRGKTAYKTSVDSFVCYLWQ